MVGGALVRGDLGILRRRFDDGIDDLLLVKHVEYGFDLLDSLQHFHLPFRPFVHVFVQVLFGGRWGPFW